MLHERKTIYELTAAVNRVIRLNKRWYKARAIYSSSKSSLSQIFPWVSTSISSRRNATLIAPY
ncbi:MAG TPA: hypothetical protein VJ734_06445, partial [Nitrosospira sp.]|nr:hypothetical protein [Nitrosospira sp.]